MSDKRSDQFRAIQTPSLPESMRVPKTITDQIILLAARLNLGFTYADATYIGSTKLPALLKALKEGDDEHASNMITEAQMSRVILRRELGGG